MYVPTPEELAQIGLGAALYSNNGAHSDDWQRLFVLVGLEDRRASLPDCVYRVRLAAKHICMYI